MDLLIEVDHLSLSVWNESTRFWTKLESTDSANQEKVLQLVRDKFLPHLGWFKALKSLVIVLRGNDYWADNLPFTAELIDWIFIQRFSENCFRFRSSAFGLQMNRKFPRTYLPIANCLHPK